MTCYGTFNARICIEICAQLMMFVIFQLWDTSALKRERIMAGHGGRVGSLSWNSYILSSGSRTGQIMHSDVRMRDHNVLMTSGHTQEVYYPTNSFLSPSSLDSLGALQGRC